MFNPYKKAQKIVSKSQNILIISHRKPDADTLGSACALKLWLMKMGKSVHLACVDKPSKAFSFLPFQDEFLNEFNLDDYDLMIVVDAGASYMTNFHLEYEDLFSSGMDVINIDHHASNDNYGTLNIVESNVASTTIIIYKMFVSLGIQIDSDMATCLLAGIYGDTGSFMHSNTNKLVYEVSSELMKAGAQIAEVGKNLFRTRSVSALRLYGHVLSNAHVTDDEVVMSVINEDDYNDSDAGPEDLVGVVDYLNMVPGSKFAVLINEDRKGNVKGSFRTRGDDVDLSHIAAEFGGGGHPKASGFCLPGKLRSSVRYSVVGLESEKRKSLDF